MERAIASALVSPEPEPTAVTAHIFAPEPAELYREMPQPQPLATRELTMAAALGRARPSRRWHRFGGATQPKAGDLVDARSGAHRHRPGHRL